MTAIARPGLYGVSVGPGDPQLMTLRAAEVLRAVDVLALPRGERATESHAAAIVSAVVDTATKRVLLLPFATAGGRDAADASREEIFARVAEELWAGAAVAFPLIGDALTYGSFAYLLERVRERLPHIPIEVVPGVTSFAAAAATMQKPLVSWDERLAVLPAVHAGNLDELRETLTTFDTVVLLKVHRCVGAVLDILDEQGLTGGAWYAERVGMAGERYVADVRTLRGQPLPYLSLLVVRKEGNA